MRKKKVSSTSVLKIARIFFFDLISQNINNDVITGINKTPVGLDKSRIIKIKAEHTYLNLPISQTNKSHVKIIIKLQKNDSVYKHIVQYCQGKQTINKNVAIKADKYFLYNAKAVL